MLVYTARGRQTGPGTTISLSLGPSTNRRLKLDYVYTSGVSSAAINSIQVDFGSAALITGGTIGAGYPLKHRSGYVAGAANIPCAIEMTFPNNSGPEIPQGITDPQVLATFSAATADGNLCVGYHYE